MLSTFASTTVQETNRSFSNKTGKNCCPTCCYWSVTKSPRHCINPTISVLIPGDPVWHLKCFGPDIENYVSGLESSKMFTAEQRKTCPPPRASRYELLAGVRHFGSLLPPPTKCMLNESKPELWVSRRALCHPAKGILALCWALQAAKCSQNK